MSARGESKQLEVTKVAERSYSPNRNDYRLQFVRNVELSRNIGSGYAKQFTQEGSPTCTNDPRRHRNPN
eukprot:5126630-Amphidinium_carterae.1